MNHFIRNREFQLYEECIYSEQDWMVNVPLYVWGRYLGRTGTENIL